ncbi:MAG: bifunctional DNA-formamidopyrimidine glycosylase/DNA-(apurinic or apyrimidinic site) lyase [Gammaproteobacteria bacterium]|nr:bifunctional DNA-formamidopyrimidine glycosylase/DNA-(apurinic or apyrimidinic site) lyase [Gammaproteobacteria bacterium]
MPELPEVETTKRGIEAYVVDNEITQVIIRHFSLRWPINPDLASILDGRTITGLSRRGKYLLFQTDSGCLIIHLGMSGKLRILQKQQAKTVLKHDHVDIEFKDGYVLRYNDPRRFGAVLWIDTDPEQHPLLNYLGPEPLTDEFDSVYLWQQIRSRTSSIKTVIMNSKIVVGVGNIYANEALFLAGIHPKTVANQLTLQHCEQLVAQIKLVLDKAIQAGGTTLKDFRKADGKPGYFAQELNVYGREGQACLHCGSEIKHFKETQRATFYCPLCQLSDSTKA